MGKIIVIEGTDGSGKQTQSNLLFESLKSQGVKVLRQSFPNYESPSAAPVKMYLAGELGENAKNVDAYQTSAIFAVDRLCTMMKYKKFLEEGGVLILDRYVQSNMIHQAGKISDLKERDRFLDWLNDFEFGDLKLPKADLVLFLDVPVDVSQRLAKERGALKNGEKKDIHEQDENHLKEAYGSAKYVAKKFGWKTIGCVDENDDLKSIDEIHELILNKVINKLYGKAIDRRKNICYNFKKGGR